MLSLHFEISWSKLATVLGSALVLLVVFARVQIFIRDRRIARLGARAPIWKGPLPYGLSFIYRMVTQFAKHNGYNHYKYGVLGQGNKHRPYTIETDLLNVRIIFTADEENIKAILTSQFADYGKGKRFNEQWHDFLGDSIFTTDGAQWHTSRQLIRPQFIKDRLSDLRVFEEHIQIMITKMQSEARAGNGTVNLTELFYRYTLDAATHFLWGESVDSLITPQNRFADAFTDVQTTQSLVARMGPLAPFVRRGKFFKGLEVLEEFLQPYIDRALALTPEQLAEVTKSDDRYTFLHALALFTRDRQVLRDQLTSVLLAARDTTAVTLQWLFYCLGNNPRVLAKLRAEILQQVGKHKAPSYGDLKDMRYLQHTLNEVLRIYPPVPYNVRLALKDTTLPVGGGPNGDEPVGILEGTAIGYSTLVLQRRDDIYPPTSEKFPDHREFVPERWDSWTPKPWTYIPFNGGPRICIGQQFALTEIGYTAVRILQKFSRVVLKMTEELKERADIVLLPSIDLVVGVSEDDE